MSRSSALASSPAPPGPSASADDSRTLSRNALYTPLRAYEQAQVDPNAYMGTLKNVPVSLKESGLSSFMQRVGEDYHRNRATGPDPRNNGSRPLTVSDMDDRLRQRAVTLVGGGVNSAMTTSKPKSTSDTRIRKRPRRQWKQVEAILNKQGKARTDAIAFLVSMNERWNGYIHQILNIGSRQYTDLRTTDEVDLRAIKGKFIAVREDIELAGAHVRIHSCKQKRHLVEVYGLLVSETKNTWTVAIRSRPAAKKRRRKDTAEDGKGVGNAVSGTMDSVEIVIVPKDGSSLDVIIPLSLSVSAAKADDPPLILGSDDCTKGAMVQLAPRSIFVRLSIR